MVEYWYDRIGKDIAWLMLLFLNSAFVLLFAPLFEPYESAYQMIYYILLGISLLFGIIIAFLAWSKQKQEKCKG
jgi:predicted ABC-type exoprotein transport system permease subunit